MKNEEILRYVRQTPYNTNKVILKQLLGNEGPKVEFILKYIERNPWSPNLIIFDQLVNEAKGAALAPGLYETGAIALYEAGDVEAASAMLKTPWDDLVASGVIQVGEEYKLPAGTELNEFCFYFGVPYTIEDSGGAMGLTFYEDGSVALRRKGETQEFPAGTAIYSYRTIDASDILGEVASVAPDGKIYTDDLVLYLGDGPAASGALYARPYDLEAPELVGDLVLCDSVTNLGKRVLEKQRSLTGIFIPDSVITIGSYSFAYCTNLTSITIPDRVISIEDKVFENCTSLTSINIHDGVTYIGNRAFDCCGSLNNITFEGTVAQWNAIEKGYDWDNNIPATYVRCSDGQVEL